MGQTDLSRPLGRDGGWAEAEPPCRNAAFAELPVRPYDLLTLGACRALAALWSALRLRRAAGMLRHYVRGTGGVRRIDADELLALPPVRAAVDEQLARWRAEALDRWAGGERWSGEDPWPLGERTPAAYPADSGWRDLLITRRTHPDWWLALRCVEFRLTGTVRVDAAGEAAVDYRFAVHKAWNFDRGKSELGVPFAPFARLHETGLAREFTVTGEAFGHG
ncbi:MULTISPECIES: hypothetical protein [Streptomyces]|uniref:hypothetical protein n=1 Tax=Streptomyces TaxID=1883 RepID=UPI00163B85E2|nr:MULTISPECIES: hypothetical protein [Streptomyces]MBC2878503.1 hypothetical protein [Streptomyces sp. TYQ1024]UBI38831.1 hypothetical protein K7I03_21825 [Streptomyces mobaraensis]UKW31411.1 hypothetical protein MCU78_21770 [Streptomyces sp. TYQ1024]